VSGVARSATLMTLFFAVLMVRWALVGLDSPGLRPETGDCDTLRRYFWGFGLWAWREFVYMYLAYSLAINI
jgi:hypothetical protein